MIVRFSRKNTQTQNSQIKSQPKDDKSVKYYIISHHISLTTPIRQLQK